MNFAIWATICLATGEFIHPWWLYVAAPPGAVLGVLYAAGIGRPNRDPDAFPAPGISSLRYRA